MWALGRALSRFLLCFPPLAAAYDYAQCYRLGSFTLPMAHDAMHTDARGGVVSAAVADMARVFAFSFPSTFAWAGIHRD